MQGNIRPRFIIAPFAFFRGRTQDRANTNISSYLFSRQSCLQVQKCEYDTGRKKSCIQHINHVLHCLLCFKSCFFILENIALHKSAWQLYPYENTDFRDSVNASKAVDGLKTNLSFFGQQCTGSANRRYEAILRVDLGAILGIHSITLYYRTENVEWGKHNCIRISYCLLQT